MASDFLYHPQFPIYRADWVDVAPEMERNYATAKHVAWPSWPSWAIHPIRPVQSNRRRGEWAPVLSLAKPNRKQAQKGQNEIKFPKIV